MEKPNIFQRLMSYLLGTDKKIYHKVNIDREVVDEILQIAQETIPMNLQPCLRERLLVVFCISTGSFSSRGRPQIRER